MAIKIRRAAGFTLIEVMVVVAIVGILAAVAYPSYMNYLVRGKVVDATSALADVRIKMEQYFQDHRDYGGAGTACTIALPVSDYFTFSCDVGNPNTTFIAVATSIAGKVGPATGDYSYTINASNAKATTKFKGVTQTGKSCWMIKGTEC